MTAVVGVVWFSGIRQSHSIKPNPHSPDEAASTCGNCESRVKAGPLHREKSSSLVTLFLNFLSWSFTWHMKMWNSHAEKWHWHYSHFTCRKFKFICQMNYLVLNCVIYRRKKHISEDLFIHVGILIQMWTKIIHEKVNFTCVIFFFHMFKFYLRIRIIYVCEEAHSTWFHMACFVSLFLSFLKCFIHMWIKSNYILILFSSYMLKFQFSPL